MASLTETSDHVASLPASRVAGRKSKTPLPDGPDSNKQIAPDSSNEEPLPFNWSVVSWLILIHLGALAAPFVFTWQGLVLFFALHWFTGGIGICLGFHRLLTHGSFKTYQPVRWFIAFLGGLAGQGSAIDWVASHRKHHALSDQQGDPHSPRDGAWWSHVLWLARSAFGTDWSGVTRRWAPDLA